MQLANRYSRTQAIADLEESIRVAREAVESTPVNHEDLGQRLHSLALRLCEQHLRTTTEAGFGKAIELAKNAIALTPDHHTERAALLSSLGSMLAKKYLETRSTTDLYPFICTCFHRFPRTLRQGRLHQAYAPACVM